MLILQGLVGMAQAAPVQWETNGHYYEAIAVPSGITWEAAKTAAENSAYSGMQGHLATITSIEENYFIVNSLGGPSYLNGFFLGGFQLAGSPEPAGGWQWVTGETWSYTNWLTGVAPNDLYSGGGTIPLPYGISEEVLHFFFYSGTWNDVPLQSGWGGYVVEYEPGTPPLDTDGDGVPDSEDNCPTISNADQADANNNDIGDACEFAYLNERINQLETQLNTLIQQFSEHTHNYYKIKGSAQAVEPATTGLPEYE